MASMVGVAPQDDNVINQILFSKSFSNNPRGTILSMLATSFTALIQNPRASPSLHWYIEHIKEQNMSDSCSFHSRKYWPETALNHLHLCSFVIVIACSQNARDCMPVNTPGMLCVMNHQFLKLPQFNWL